MPISVKAPQGVKNTAALRADAMFDTITSKTPAEVGAYFDANLSALSGMDPGDIDAWIDANVNNLAEAKTALKTLAKDSAFISSVTKSLAKALVVIARKI